MSTAPEPTGTVTLADGRTLAYDDVGHSIAIDVSRDRDGPSRCGFNRGGGVVSGDGEWVATGNRRVLLRTSSGNCRVMARRRCVLAGSWCASD